MNKKLHTLYLVLIYIVGIAKLSAQVPDIIQYQPATDQGQFEQLVIDELKANDFFEMSNVQVTGIFGDAASVGNFSNGQIPLGIEEGIILSNARIDQFIGENTVTGAGNNLGLPGSSNLDSLFINSGVSIDQSAIQFSFIPSRASLSLEYIFASEEYCDFVSSVFNDILGVFLAGPGIAGPFIVNGMPAINIAEFIDVNGVALPVNINTINHLVNDHLYVDNNTPVTSTANICATLDITNNQFTQLSQFDGWTVPLTATYENLQIGETYHLQIAIADGGDPIFGSAIYLAKNGFNAGAQTLIADAGMDMQLDCIVPSVTLGGDSTSVGSEFTYEWVDQTGQVFSTNAFVDVDIPGEYILNVGSTMNSQIASDTVLVSLDITQPVVTASALSNINCITPEVTIIGETDVTNPEYLWEGPSGSPIFPDPTTKDITVSVAGNYVLTVTNLDNGCISSVSVEVLIDTEAPQASIQVSGDLTCENETVFLLANGDFSNAFEWFFQGAPLGNQVVIEVSQPGVYELIVNNLNNGCTTSTNVEVLENIEAPFATIAPPQVLNCANPTVLLDASASDSGPGIVYIWSNQGSILANSNTLSVSSCGVYQLEVQNTNNGCSSMVEVEVLCDQDIPVSSISTPDQLTPGSVLALNASTSSVGPNFTYLWTSPNGGNIVSGANTLTPNINQPGTYCLTITNTNNQCVVESCVEVQFDVTATVVADAGPDQTLDCNSPSVPLGGPNTSMGPEFTYEWFFLGDSIANMPFIEVSSNGGYIFTVTNTFTGEQASDTAFVSTQFEFIGLGLTASNMLTCLNNVSTLDVFTELFYFEETSTLWETSDGNIISDPTQNMIDVDQPGTYSVVVTNISSGCTGSGSIIVEEDREEPSVALAFLNQGVLNCVITTETLIATTDINESDATFEWTTPAGNVLSDIALSSIEAMDCGTYTLTVTNINNGCFTQASITVACEDDLPDVIISQPQILNPGQSIILDATASSTELDLTFTWTTDNGNIVSGGNTLTPTVDQAGVYCLTILNTNTGCEDTVCAVVQQGAGSTVVADAGPGQELTCQIAAVTLDGSSSSVGAEFTYSWTFLGQEISDEITVNVFEPGVYTLTVTNTLTNEQATDFVTVTIDIDLVDFIPIAPENLTCTNNIVTISVELITDPSLVSVLWETQEGNIISDPTQTSIEVDQPGTYNVTLTNSGNACLSIVAFEVLQDVEAPSVAAIPSNNGLITCTNQTVTIEGVTNVDPSEAIFEWVTLNGSILSDASLQNIEVGDCGNYIFHVTNTSNGCISESIAEVLCNDNLPVAVIQEPFVLEPGQSIQLNASTSSTGPSFQYSWTTVDGNIIAGINTLTPTIDQAGEYCLTIINAENGCVVTSCVSVQQGTGATVIADAGPNQILTCNNSQVMLDGSGSSIGNEFTYSWTDALGNEVSTEITTPVTGPGIYTLTVTNTQTGEIASDTVEILEDINIPTAIIQLPAPEILTCEISEVFIELDTDLDPSEASFLWQGPGIVSDPTQKDITANEAGIYEVVVTNINTGCFVTSSVLVTSSVEILNITSGGFIITCEDSLLLNPADIYDTFMLGELTQGVWEEQAGLDIGDFPLATASQSGDYNFTGVNPQTLCPVQITFTVEIAEQISVDAGIDQVISCRGDEIILNAELTPDVGNFGFEWSRDNISIFTTGASITVSTPGTYQVLITDLDSGCTSSDEVIVTLAQDIFTVTPQVTNVSCFGANDGSIIFDITGGEEPYTFLGGFPSQTDLAPGIYPVTIVDNLQCSFETAIEIAEPDLLEVDFDLTADGDLLASPIGGVSPYECAWNTGVEDCLLVDPDFSMPLDLSVTDANGCVTTIKNILEPTAVRGLQAEELNVFPNPADDYVIINQEGIASALDDLRLVDLQGRSVAMTHAIQDQDNVKMNLQTLTPGVYFIHVILDQKLHYQKLIVH